MNLKLLVACMALAACKPVLTSGIQYQGSELMGVEDQTADDASVRTTADAGRAAQAAGLVGGFFQQGAGLNGVGQALRIGARMCVSSDYGRANGKGGGNANETAVKCGKLEPCDQRDGYLKNLPAKPGDLCMRADCLSKSSAGLDMPGEINEGVCGTNGRSTAFNVSQYIRDFGAFSLDIKPQGGMTLTEGGGGYDTGILAGDRAYASTKGAKGNVAFNLGGESLGSFNAFATIYESNGLALNQGGGTATTTAYNGVEHKGLTFAEDGFGTNDSGGGGGSPPPSGGFPQGTTPGGNAPLGTVVDNNSSGGFPQGAPIDGSQSGDPIVTDGATLTGTGPTPEQLGLIKTRQGNTFQLTGESFGLGAAGTVKVFIANQ